jgi:uncharacterized protein YbjT (DUF2867 family)
MKIVITGSLGNISRPLSQQLVNEGHTVTVVTSNQKRKIEIETIGAIPAVGNVNDSDFLTNVFAEADSVYCMTPPDFSQPDQHEYYRTIAHNYDEAIRNSDVERVVYLSSYGAHLPSGTGFVTGSYVTEQILNKIPDIALTHVRPTYFYYNLKAFVNMIRSVGLIGAVYGGEDKLALVHPRDIASVVAEELQKQNSGTSIRYINSDEKTCNEIAEVLGRAIGIPDLKWVTITKDQALDGLRRGGVPENAAQNLVELGLALHSGRLLEDYEQNKPTFGSVKLNEFAVEFAEIFQNNAANIHVN